MKMSFGKYCGQSLVEAFQQDRAYIDDLISKKIIAVRGSAYLVMMNDKSSYARMLKKQINDYL